MYFSNLNANVLYCRVVSSRFKYSIRWFVPIYTMWLKERVTKKTLIVLCLKLLQLICDYVYALILFYRLIDLLPCLRLREFLYSSAVYGIHGPSSKVCFVWCAIAVYRILPLFAAAQSSSSMRSLIGVILFSLISLLGQFAEFGLSFDFN